MKTRLKLNWLVLLVIALAGLLSSARAFYAPAEQRWLNRDPIEEQGGVNLYAIVRNNPANWRDNFGLDPTSPPMIAKPKPPHSRNPAVGSPTQGTIYCKNGKYTIWMPWKTPVKQACYTAHELQHMSDWKNRYGENSCNGVPDGELPRGDAGYMDFRNDSECKAHQAEKECAKNQPCPNEAGKEEAQAVIAHADTYLSDHNCPQKEQAPSSASRSERKAGRVPR